METATDRGLRPYRFTFDVYDRLAASGVFGDKSSIFLGDGELVEKVGDTSTTRPHVYAVNQLGHRSNRLVPEGWHVEQDHPMTMGADSASEPDPKVARGAIEDYRDRAPAAYDVPMVIEVSDASLEDDKGRMLRAYAGAMIPIYWVVNLPGRTIEVFQNPSGPTASPAYASRQEYGPDDEVPVILDGREVGRLAAKALFI